MAEERTPFADVLEERGGLSLPELKWRELLFIRAFRPVADGVFVRDPSRPLPAFERADLFPEDACFRAVSDRGRVRLERVPRPGGSPRERV